MKALLPFSNYLSEIFYTVHTLNLLKTEKEDFWSVRRAADRNIETVTISKGSISKTGRLWWLSSSSTPSPALAPCLQLSTPTSICTSVLWSRHKISFYLELYFAVRTQDEVRMRAKDTILLNAHNGLWVVTYNVWELIIVTLILSSPNYSR